MVLEPFLRLLVHLNNSSIYKTLENVHLNRRPSKGRDLGVLEGLLVVLEPVLGLLVRVGDAQLADLSGFQGLGVR